MVSDEIDHSLPNLLAIEQSSDQAAVDRQAAWCLFVLMTGRIGVAGSFWDQTGTNLEGEILAETLKSMHDFVGEVRELLANLNVGNLPRDPSLHLGSVIYGFRILAVLNPYLHRCHEFRYWWEESSDRKLVPFARQAAYPGMADLLSDLIQVRRTVRLIQSELARSYGFDHMLSMIQAITPFQFAG